MSAPLDPAAALLDRPFGELTFLVGAGISRNPPASLPTVGTFLATALDHCRVPAGVRRNIERKSLRPNAPRFEVLVDGIRELGDPHLELASAFDTATFNRLHSLLAAFLARGSSLVTTNFDNCIELASGHPATRRVPFQGADLPPRRHRIAGLLLKPHGSSPLPGESTAAAAEGQEEVPCRRPTPPRQDGR